MTWVQLTEQEAKMQQGWKDGHTFGMHIFHLFAVLKCFGTLGELMTLGTAPSYSPAITMAAIGLLIYSWIKKQPTSLMFVMPVPPAAAIVSVILFAPQYFETLLITTALSSLVWFLFGWLYAVLSSAYRLNYKYEVKIKKDTQSPIVSNTQHTATKPVVQSPETEVTQLPQVGEVNKESTQEVVSTPQVLMVITVILAIAVYILFMQAKG